MKFINSITNNHIIIDNHYLYIIIYTFYTIPLFIPSIYDDLGLSETKRDVILPIDPYFSDG